MARPSGSTRRAACCRSTVRPESSAIPSDLLVLHDGRTLIRLDPATGSKRWSCSLGSQDLSERPGAMAYDDRRFYLREYGHHLWRAAAGGAGRLAGRRLGHLDPGARGPTVTTWPGRSR